jgi:hypothetical protein
MTASLALARMEGLLVEAGVIRAAVQSQAKSAAVGGRASAGDFGTDRARDYGNCGGSLSAKGKLALVYTRLEERRSGLSGD